MSRNVLLVALLLLAALGMLTAPALNEPVAARDFLAHLSGSEEVPPVDTHATGQAIFELNGDGAELHYTLSAENASNITQAHIHLGAAGMNGSIVVWLYPRAPPPKLIPGVSNGVLAEGTITAKDLVGPLAGKPLSALVDAMGANNTYANIHTAQHPDGEIRGQIRAVLPSSEVTPASGGPVPVPEFPMGIVMPVTGVLGMVFLLSRRKGS